MPFLSSYCIQILFLVMLLLVLLQDVARPAPGRCLSCLRTWLVLLKDVARPASRRCWSWSRMLFVLLQDVVRPASGRCSSCFRTLFVLLQDIASPASGRSLGQCGFFFYIVGLVALFCHWCTVVASFVSHSKACVTFFFSLIFCDTTCI